MIVFKQKFQPPNKSAMNNIVNFGLNLDGLMIYQRCILNLNNYEPINLNSTFPYSDCTRVHEYIHIIRQNLPV